jgi:hypothetical protein
MTIRKHVFEVIQPDKLWRMDNIVFGKAVKQRSANRINIKPDKTNNPGHGEENSPK